MKKFILYFIIPLFISCSVKVKDDMKKDINVLSLSTERVREYALLSEIASSVVLVPLETSDEVLINEIRNVRRSGEHFFVSDGQSVYKYNVDGSFVSKLNRIGSGPEEYLQISDFQLDSIGNLWVLSKGSKNIYKYSQSNEFLGKIALPYWVDNIELLDDDTMILYVGNETDGNNSDQIKLLSLSKKEIIDGFLEIDANKAIYLHVISENHFSAAKDKNKRYFFQLFNDTVYTLSRTGLEPYLFVNIDDKNVPESFFDSKYNNIMAFFQELFKHAYAYGTGFYVESEKSYWYSYYYNKQCHITSVPKSEGDGALVFTGIKDDVNLYNYPIKLGEVDLFIQSNNQLIIPLLPFTIMEYAEEYLSAKEKEDLYRTLDLSSDKNPILLQITLL